MTLDALGWNEFHVAMMGATAALAGLVIVAASVNIAKIVTASTITSRLAAAIAALLLVLAVSSIALIPGISVPWFGVVAIVAMLPAAVFQFHATVVIVRDPSPAARARIAKSAVGWVPLAAYAVAGVTAIVGIDTGVVIAAFGAVMAVVSAVIVSWVALVEILR